MIKQLPLYPGASPCVGSGMCCKKAPCQFGKSTGPDNPTCIHLKEIEQTYGRHKRYTCGIASHIVEQHGWEISPAFGAGCCSSLFNEDRNAIIRDIRNDTNPTAAITKHHSKNDKQ